MGSMFAICLRNRVRNVKFDFPENASGERLETDLFECHERNQSRTRIETFAFAPFGGVGFFAGDAGFAGGVGQ